LKSVVGGRTRLLLLTNLHNPSGVGIPADTLRGVVEIASDAGAWVLSDEVYRDFVGDRFPSAWGMGDRVVVTSSLTKFLGMGGVRMGWALAPPELLERMSRCNDYVQIVSSFASEYIGEKAFEGMARLVDRAMTIAAENRKIMDDWIASEPRARWVPPDGGVIAFPQLLAGDGKPVDSLSFTEHLIKTQDTLAGPGALFGVDGHLRIGFGGDPEQLKEGLRRVSAGLDTWQRL
jgi:aspartate/methionine/tyrosine aminotransferase